MKLVSVVECSLEGVQQGPTPAKGAIIKSALSSLNYYLTRLSKVMVMAYTYKHVFYCCVLELCVVTLSASVYGVTQTLSEHTWTSPSQQAKLHLVIEANHFVHTRMSDYVDLFEEDSQWLVYNLLLSHV